MWVKNIHAFFIIPITGPNIAVKIVVINVFPALSKCVFIFDKKDFIASFTESINVERLLLPDLNHATNFCIISLTKEANNPIITERKAFPPMRKASSRCDFFPVYIERFSPSFFTLSYSVLASASLFFNSSSLILNLSAGL